MSYEELLNDTKTCDINVCFEDGTWVALDLRHRWWEYQEVEVGKLSYYAGRYTLDCDSKTVVVDFDGADVLPENVIKVLKWFYKINLYNE